MNIHELPTVIQTIKSLQTSSQILKHLRNNENNNCSIKFGLTFLHYARVMVFRNEFDAQFGSGDGSLRTPRLHPYLSLIGLAETINSISIVILHLIAETVRLIVTKIKIPVQIMRL